jgi:general secretion pathway protein G
MMHKAFMMIELIFIIVIIGILAAVAIPKLAASRADAEGAKLAYELSACIEDAAEQYMEKSRFGGITNGALQTRACLHASRCFTIQEYDNNGTITVYNNADTSAGCREAQRIAERNILLGSHTINF